MLTFSLSLIASFCRATKSWSGRWLATKSSSRPLSCASCASTRKTGTAYVTRCRRTGTNHL